MTTPEKLTAKQERFIPYLLEASSLEEACKKARIGKSTAYSWFRSALFRDEVDSRRKEIAEVAFSVLKASVTKATEKLIEQMANPKPTVSIRAAESIIDFAQKAVERDDLEKKIRELEKRIGKKGSE